MSRGDIAVVGVTSPAGEAVLTALAERGWAGQVYALERAAAAGGRVELGERYLRVAAVETFDFSSVQVALFVGAPSLSEQFAPAAVATGCWAVDATGCFSVDASIPLIVPEVNAERLGGLTGACIVASPGSMSVALLVALGPLHAGAGLERIQVSTYQSVSGSGKAGVEELAQQAAMLLNGRTRAPRVYSKQIAFNCLPEVGAFGTDGFTAQELALAADIPRVLGDSRVRVNATAVRVPVFFGEAASVQLETRERLEAAAARALLAAASGIKIVDTASNDGYPTAVTDAIGHDAVFVGRIREDRTHPRGLNFWMVADNVHKGTALNGILIAECLVRGHP